MPIIKAAHFLYFCCQRHLLFCAGCCMGLRRKSVYLC
ncbi:MAG: hypothetical protein HFH33_01665 [Eubacterium sp.]|nr:hypothetical protein [Eubacterium sp.]